MDASPTPAPSGPVPRRFRLPRWRPAALLLTAGALTTGTANAASYNIQLVGGVDATTGGACATTVNSRCRFSNVVVGAGTGPYQRDLIVTVSRLTNGATITTALDNEAPTLGTGTAPVATPNQFFAPTVTVNGAANAVSWAEFTFDFVLPGAAAPAVGTSTTTLPGTFTVSSFDTDGTSTGLREFVEFPGVTAGNAGISSGSSLTTGTAVSGGINYQGALAAQGNISVENAYKASAVYRNVSSFRVIYGARLGATAQSATNSARLTALNFFLQDNVLSLSEVDGYKSVKLTTDADGSGTVTAGDTLTYTLTYVNTGNANVTGFQIADPLPANVTFTPGSQTVSVGGTTSPTAKNAAYTGSGANTNLLAGSVTLAANSTVTVTIPVVVGAGAAGTTLSNQASATGTGLTATLSDNVDTSTTFPPSVTANASWTAVPVGSVGQTATASLGPTTVAVARLVLSGRVFGDPNYNGVPDTGETGLSGVTVGLYDAAGTTLIGTTTTDAGGTYSFNVSANTTYTVRATGPSGQGPTNPSPASRTVAVTTTNVTGQDFGFNALPTCSAVLAVAMPSTTTNATLYVLNTGTGAPLGTALRTLQVPSYAMAVMASGTNVGRVYYIGNTSTGAAPLRYYDFTTGTDALAATVAQPSSGAYATRMAIDKTGVGYVMYTDGTLMRFTTGADTSTVTRLGVATLNNVPGATITNYGFGDMAFDNAGVLWALFTDNTGGAAAGQGILFTLDVSTTPPSATPVDNVTVGGTVTSLNMFGLAFDGSGSLYGQTTGDVYSVSPANANAVKKNSTASPTGMYDLGSCSYPAIAPAITITKTTSAATARPGDPLTYSITVTNSGTSAATAVTLKDVIPANTTYVPGSTTTNGAATADATGNTMPYAGGGVIGSAGSFPGVVTVGVGQEVTVVFKVTVNNPYPDGAAGVSNTANVTYSGGPAGGLNSLPATTGVGTDLRVSKTGPQYVAAGKAVAYTVTVTNAGLRAANGAVVRDPAVPNFTATGVTCTGAGGAACPAGLTVAALQAGATVATFPAGGALTLTVTGTAGTGTIVNGASVTIPSTLPDLDPANNAASATTQIINLVLTKEVRNCGPIAPGAACPATAAWGLSGTGRPGDVLEYRISYSNTGTANAAGVVIQDSVPTNTAADLSGYASGKGLSWVTGAATPTLLTSATDTDAGSLSATQLLLNVGTVAPGGSGSVSFRSVIR